MKKPCFVVQNNFVQPIIAPVQNFARERGYGLEQISFPHTPDPANCGIDWDQYGALLPYGTLSFVRKLKESMRFFDYVFYEQDAFSASVWESVVYTELLSPDGEFDYSPHFLNSDGTFVYSSHVPVLLKGAPRHVRHNRTEPRAFASRVLPQRLGPTWSRKARCLRISFAG